MTDAFRLDGKVALVIGGTSGIGAAIARKAAKSGWNVMISYASNASAAASVVADCEAAGAKAYAVKADAAKLDDTESLFAQARKHFGVLDGFVNNAGVTGRISRLTEATPDHIREVIDINVTGAILSARAAIPLMSKKHGGRGGAIVNIGSGCNKIAFPKLVAYTASKGGIEMFTKVGAVELGPHKIRVNCVAPGAVEIERTRLELPDYAGFWGSRAPLGRVGTPADIAPLVVYLISDESSYISGTEISVDGGEWAHGGTKVYSDLLRDLDVSN